MDPTFQRHVRFSSQDVPSPIPGLTYGERSTTMHARRRARLLAGLAAPLAVAGALAGAGPAAQASAAGASPAACPGWSIVPSPVSPGDAVNSLSSVTVLSPTNAYA